MIPQLPVRGPLPPGSRGFFLGVRAFLAGLKLMLPGGGLFLHALAPVLASLVVLVLLVVGSVWLTTWLLGDWLAGLELPGWLAWLGGALALILGVVIAYLLFEPTMTLLGPVFMDPICEKVHLRFTGRPLLGPRSAQAFLKRQLFAVVQSIKWTLLTLFVEIPLMIFGLLTVAGVVVSVGVSGILRGVDLMDYPHSGRHYTLRDKLRWARAHWGAVTGLGAAAVLCMLVPGLNLFVTPAGAAGATLLMLAADETTPQSS